MSRRRREGRRLPSEARSADAAPRPLTEALETWLAAHRTLIVAAIAVASIALRFGYFQQLNGGPLLRQHLWDQSDMLYYDGWARAIASGDWLSRDVHPPLHKWHEEVAADYYRLHPNAPPPLRTDLPAGDAERERARALWERWAGGGRFYADPLYPYLVGLTYRLFGTDVRWVFGWQMLLGVATNVLVYLAVRRSLGDLVAVASGIVATLYAPALFYEMLLLRDSPIVFAGLALAWLVGWALDSERPLPWLMTGAAFGIATMLKANFILFFGMAALAAIASNRRGRRTIAALALALVAGVLIGLAPAIFRNLAVGVPAFGLATNGANTFVMSNTRGVGPFGWELGEMGRILGDGENRFFPAVVATLLTHEGPASYLRLLWLKFALAWHWFESPNNENFYYYALHASVLRGMPFTFTLVGPLGFVGLLLGLRQLRRALPLYILIAAHLLVLLLFTIFSRYRIPMATACIPFAALTLVRLLQWLDRRRFKPLLATLLGLLLVSAWTTKPLPEGTPLIRRVDFELPYVVYYVPLLEEADRRSDFRTMARILSECLAREPREVREMGPAQPARNRLEAELADLFAEWHRAHAWALSRLGEKDAAALEEQRTRELEAAARVTGPDRFTPRKARAGTGSR